MLLVDEDPVMTAVAAIELSAAAIEVSQVTDLAGAIGVMSDRPPDLVVLDAGTHEFADWVSYGLGRPDRIPADARVMLIRPLAGDTGHRMGVAGYLRRPFAPGELLTAIRSLVGDSS